MNKERLKNGLEKMGIAADETALDRFEAFHAILDEYNARMDLTAVLDEDERVDRHDLDSAAPLAHGLLMPGAKVIDVGTGAGFPGMPLLILRPDLQMTFLDALNKRILFLEDALARLGGETWFRLGDLDLATHLRRTELLADGWTPSRVTEPSPPSSTTFTRSRPGGTKR